jgi:hypothetical protein
MRKTLLPMVASLALCGAATVALIATNARAEQQSSRKPVMIALVTPTSGHTTAAPPAEGSASTTIRDGVVRDGMMRREQICRDLYAGKVGELASWKQNCRWTPNRRHCSRAGSRPAWISPISTKPTAPERPPVLPACAASAPVWWTAWRWKKIF